MYALASLGLRLFCVAGVGQCALPRVGCTPWRPSGSASFAWQARATMCTAKRPLLRGRRETMCTAKGVGCTPWRPSGSASFAWQAWDNVHCQRVGVPRASPLLRGRRGTMCAAKGSDVRPGVPRAPPLLRGRRGTMCAAKESNVRPGVPRAPPLWRGRRGTMCTVNGSELFGSNLPGVKLVW